jgi:hypothetical protein
LPSGGGSPVSGTGATSHRGGAEGANQALVVIRDLSKALGQELERGENMGDGSGPFAIVGLQGGLVVIIPKYRK